MGPIRTLSVGGLVLACSADPEPAEDTGCLDASCAVDSGSPFDEPSRVVLWYGLSAGLLPIDSAGNVGTASTDSGPLPRLTVHWLDAPQGPLVLCESEYAIDSTSLAGGPFEVVYGADVAGSWNAWRWALTFDGDDCDGVATPDDREQMADLVPDVIYVAVSPVAGDTGQVPFDPPVAGWSLWSSGGDPDATDPTKGGRFSEVNWASAVYDWDGSPDFDGDAAVRTKGLDALEPGEQVLRDVVVHSNIIRVVAPL